MMFFARSRHVDSNPGSRAAARAVRKRELEAETAGHRRGTRHVGSEGTVWRQWQVERLALLCARTNLTVDEISTMLGKPRMEVRHMAGRHGISLPHGETVASPAGHSLHSICRAAAWQYGVDISDLMSTDIRNRHVSMARRTVCYWTNRLLGLPSSEISLFLGMDVTTARKTLYAYPARRKQYKRWVRTRKGG